MNRKEPERGPLKTVPASPAFLDQTLAARAARAGKPRHRQVLKEDSPHRLLRFETSRPWVTLVATLVVTLVVTLASPPSGLIEIHGP